MNKTFINSFNVKFAQDANKLIYYLKKIPILGKKIPNSLYKKTEAKLILGVIGEILSIIKGILFKTLYLGLMILLPAYLITKDMLKVRPYFLHMFFVLSFVTASLIKTSIFDMSNDSSFYMIRLMRADARTYYRSHLLYERVIEFIEFIIPITLIGVFIHIAFWKILILLLELTAFRVIGEAIYLLVYDKLNNNLEKNNYFQNILVIIGLASAYIPCIMKKTINLQNILFNMFVETIIILCGVLSLIYVWNYKRYTTLSKSLLVKENMIDFDDLEKEINFGDVKLSQKKINTQILKSKDYKNKEGYEYLNSLFFLRFKSVIVSPIKIISAIIGIVFLILILLSLFIEESGPKIIEIIYEKPSIFIFIMYIISTGEKTCRALFYNCDVKLLRYRYYRRSDAILNNFKIRLKKIVFLNIIPALEMCLCILGVVILNGYLFEITKLIPVLLCIVCLSCFFSIHYLFLYYVIQPYTAELKVKSTLFNLINWGLYLICYECIKIETHSYYFTLGVVIFTILYIIIALILVYKLSPKTFKLR